MAKLSDSQIAAAARSAGLSGEAVAIAVAIAIAESGGDPRAHNTNRLTGDNSYGVWQINMLGSMGPERRRKFGISSNDALFDPAVNAKAMAMLSNGGKKWSDWSTYNRGTYKLYLSRGKAVAGSSDTVTTPVADNSLSSIVRLGALAVDGAVWRKAGFFILGVTLVIVGILWLTAGAGVGAVKSVGKSAKQIKSSAANVNRAVN